ncbi:MAG TPA: hypothetical protein VGJ33_13935 [Candidatus Angelobacter sp.]|jgi:hypothetical protein
MIATHRSEFPARNKSYRASIPPDDKKKGRRHVSGQHSTIFLPGHPVPESGIYEVIHDKGHRLAHEAVMYRNDPFPVCDQCHMRVRFKLIRSAPYIFDDEDFAKE